MSVAFSPDSKRILTAGGDKMARVYDATTGALQLELKGPTGKVECTAFSPNGTQIATAVDGGVAKVWDARTGKILLDWRAHKIEAMRVAFSRDGARIVTGSWDGTVKVWDARTGTPRLELDGIKGSICAALSPDGTWIVTGGREFEQAGVATVRDARTGIPNFALEGFKGSARSVAISKDGTRIVTGGEDVATVWDARTGAPLMELKGLKESVYSVAFSPDGTRILTAGMRILPAGSTEPNDEVKVKVWDATTGTVLLDLTKEEPLYCSILAWQGLSVAFSPDGRRFVIGGVRKRTTTGYDQVKVRDARTGMVLVELKGIETLVRSVAFSPDGTRIATGSLSNTATVWDAHTGTALFELKGHTGNVDSVAFSPDGKRIVTGSGDRTVRAWDVRTATTLAELKGHAGAVTSVSFSANGTRLLTAGGGEVFVWDAPIPRQEGERIPGDEELAYRRVHTQPNPSRYRADYLTARAAKDDFAATFYLNLIPPEERKGVLAQADAEAFAALSKLAYENWRTKRLEEAAALYLEVLNVNKARLGPEDPATIQAAEDLGDIYHQAGQFEKAIPLMEEVVKYRKAKLGRDNGRTTNVMRKLGRAYKDADQFKEAIAVLEEDGAKHPRILANLLDAYALAGEHAKLVARCLKELTEVRKSRPEDWWQQADRLARLGRAYLAQGKWAEAEPHLWECVALREKNRPDDWTMFDAQSLLGQALLAQKKYAEAEPLLLKGYEGLKPCEKALAPGDAPRVVQALDRLVELYTGMDKPDEAKKWREERATYPEAKNAAAPEKR